MSTAQTPSRWLGDWNEQEGLVSSVIDLAEGRRFERALEWAPDQRLGRFERRLADLWATFITVPSDQGDAGIRDSQQRIVDALDLDRALQKLEQLDPDQGRIVEMRFFGGLTVEETAAALGISPATVKREWALAKGYLYRELTADRNRRRDS
jgi:RNA polymerase sigma factor (sigma-70 family)